MNFGFWRELHKPIMALAPMANVTDAAFRRIIAKYGKFTRPDGTKGGGPDVMFTEFVSCDGLCSEGREHLLADLQYDESERPIVAQFFGATPENFYTCAKLAQELGFDGIDINMGCPDRNVERQGAGAVLMKNPSLAQEIINATIRGAGNLPVSVKTRIGYTENTLREWLPYLLNTGIAVITLHLRTRKEMSNVPAHWNAAREAVTIRDAIHSHTLILANGDVVSVQDAEEKAKLYGVDGVMVGRGIFGNPWFFNTTVHKDTVPLQEKLRVMCEHTFLFEKIFKGKKNFDIMKKHYGAYAQGFAGAKELRMKLMECKSAQEIYNIVQKYSHTL